MPEEPNEKLYKGSPREAPTRVTPKALHYAELDVTTNYSFLRGASHPDELVHQSAVLGQKAMAVTDVNSLAGVVRVHEKALPIANFQLIVGVRLVFIDGAPDLLVWPTDRAAYARLCLLLTLGRKHAAKGECHLHIDDFLEHSQGQMAAFCLPFDNELLIGRLHDALGDRLSLAISLGYGGEDESRLQAAQDLAHRTHVPLVATNHVHYHDLARRPLHDVLTCTRHGCTVHNAGFRLFPNAERHLKSPEQMHALFRNCPQAIARGLEIVGRCKSFSLKQLKYEYPTEIVPAGKTPTQHLRNLTIKGARKKYPHGMSKEVLGLIYKELRFIRHTKYESYFLTVYDLVREARSRGILAQGRGSAANSAVCFCLGITAVDPAHFQLVFERFASTARNEPPDIDIDFEHERREEIIQYVYDKYGRDRAAMTASIITYRGRSAVRDVGKALGLSEDLLDQLADKLDWWHSGKLTDSQLAEAGVQRSDKVIEHLISLTTELLGFPRHLSQHVGGMVISQRPICEIVPVENASMEDRTVIEWDKDDINVLGLFKVDILALGMLTAISKALVLIAQYDKPLELHTIPSEDKKTYDMICDADTIGVFQIESRAQMSMLPRLRPREFYDLVIEVAIVRPGPIQGDMVHPYLLERERQRADPSYRVKYPKPELEGVLLKTLGVPLFQEQAMRMAIVAAGFSGTEADALRRAMAAWKRSAGLGGFHDKFIKGMLKNGYELDFAQRCFKQISGFGEYGFPESHAASFAKLVYASAWIKRYHPAAFAAALLNSQPMGFYGPAQLVRDAREHGVKVRPADVNASHWDCTLEDLPAPNAELSDVKHAWGQHGPALRLGLRQIKGMRQDDAGKIVAARAEHGSFTSVEQLRRITDLDASAVHRLAEADALASMQLTRRQAAWETAALWDEPAPLVENAISEPPPVQLPLLPLVAEVHADYAATGLSLKQHPVHFARAALAEYGVVPNIQLLQGKHGQKIRVAGLVLVRQRPGTASGVVFVTLEDETGIANLILWSPVYERYRRAARHATLLQCDGILQREGQVIHVLARRLDDRTQLLSGLHQPSRDFH